MDDLRCLMSGGAGYVGSHVVHELESRHCEVVVLDSLYSGRRWAIGNARMVEGDIGAAATVATLLSSARFDALLHFAAHIWVGESVTDPGKYYRTNTSGAATLFALAARHGVTHVVLSSTAAVYGQPGTTPIPETAPLQPLNPTKPRR